MVSTVVEKKIVAAVAAAVDVRVEQKRVGAWCLVVGGTEVAVVGAAAEWMRMVVAVVVAVVVAAAVVALVAVGKTRTGNR